MADNVIREADEAAGRAAAAPGDAIVVDDRAVVCSWAGVFTLSGDYIGPARATVEWLANMLTYLDDNKRLRIEGTIPAEGTRPQVWLLGSVLDGLGWGLEPRDQEPVPLDVLQDKARIRLTRLIARALPYLEAKGWRARENWEAGGAWLHLERAAAPGSRRRTKLGVLEELPTEVDVVLADYLWTTPCPIGEENWGILGDPATLGRRGLPADAGEEQMRAAEEQQRIELARRLRWCIEHLAILPGMTATRTAAAVAGKPWCVGARRNRDIDKRGLRSQRAVIPDGAVEIPTLGYRPRGPIEPPADWAVEAITGEELAAADRIAILTSRGGHLASFSVPMPIGEPRRLSLPEQRAALWNSDDEPRSWPTGLWAVRFPLPADVPGWDVMPAAHPTWWAIARENPDTPVFLTVTTETLKALAQEWTGGLGLDWCREHLELVEGWQWDRSGKTLAKFQSTVGGAYKAALHDDDHAMKAFTTQVFRGYDAALSGTPAQWGKFRPVHEHPEWHSNPLAQANIHADARWRCRRRSVDIYGRTDLWPKTHAGTALGYLVPEGLDLAQLADDDSDNSLTLGRMVLERWCVLSERARDELFAARGPEQVAKAMTGAFTSSPHMKVVNR